MKSISLIITLFLLLSCGKKVEEEEEEIILEESGDGTYSAILIPVNSRISGHVNGDVKVSKYGDHFKVEVQIKNAPSGYLKQYIHTGSTCPRLTHDTNGDGYLDHYETRQQTGYAVVPLDGDLASQRQGANYVLKGNYRYSRSTSYYLMLSDLHLPDEIVNDSIIKLYEKDLVLERRVITVYVAGTRLPGSVTGGELPVACGVLTRISEVPPPDDSDTWEEEEAPRRRPRPDGNYRRRPRPRPVPEPEIGPPPTSGSWWDRVRQRWRRWRGRGTPAPQPESPGTTP